MSSFFYVYCCQKRRCGKEQFECCMDSRVSVSRELYHAFGVEYLKFLLVLSLETFLLHCRLIQSSHVGVAYTFSAIYRLPSMLKQVAVAHIHFTTRAWRNGRSISITKPEELQLKTFYLSRRTNIVTSYRILSEIRIPLNQQQSVSWIRHCICCHLKWMRVKMQRRRLISLQFPFSRRFWRTHTTTVYSLTTYSTCPGDVSFKI